MPAKTLTQKRLKKLFHYTPETGIFTRLLCTANCTKIGDVAGSLTVEGYLTIYIDGKANKSHRLAWLYVHGKFPPLEIDHINGVKSDNRMCNLRSVTHSKNGRNQKLRASNTSGVMGVCWYKGRAKWQAVINVNKKRRNLGYFDFKDDAIRVRLAAEKNYGYHSNHGRA